MNKRTTPIICIAGKSGCGKTTLVRDAGLPEVISFANRKMREGEKQGDPYYFVSTDDLLNMNKQEIFAEFHETYPGDYKACSWEEINTKKAFVITPEGIKHLRELGIPVYTILLSGEPFVERRSSDIEPEYNYKDYDLVMVNNLPREINANFLKQLSETIQIEEEK